jgi:hypothetical protein
VPGLLFRSVGSMLIGDMTVSARVPVIPSKIYAFNALLLPPVWIAQCCSTSRFWMGSNRLDRP